MICMKLAFLFKVGKVMPNTVMPNSMLVFYDVQLAELLREVKVPMYLLWAVGA